MSSTLVFDINIWDDYPEDNCIPDNKVQQTSAFVEGLGDWFADDEDDEEQEHIPESTIKTVLTDLLNEINENFADIVQGVEMEVVLYDSRKKISHTRRGLSLYSLGIAIHSSHS